MGKFIDITGQKYNRLTVIKRAESKGKKAAWLCKCDCGNECIVLGQNLKKELTKSCGCLRVKHKMSGSRLYNIYETIKQRCCNPKYRGYKYYGERGISICEEWNNSFEKFFKWAMINGYSDDLTIDRIDVNGNYEPSNCRWVTFKKQQNNRRNNHLITYNGETHSISEWAEIRGINRGTLSDRIVHLKWDIKRALEY